MICEDSKSKKIDALKAIAIFSVVCAHCNTVSFESSFGNLFIHYVLNAVGTVGVCLFFVISGYLFEISSSRKKKFCQFIIKKLNGIIIPWFFCGTAVYLYITLRKGGLSIYTWISFLIGKGSYMYFLPVLLVLYMTGWIIQNKTSIKYVLILLSIISNALTYVGFFSSPYMNLNVINWFVFWGVGMVIAEREIHVKKSIECISLVISIIIIIWISNQQVWFNYWYPGFLIFAAIAILGCVFLASKIYRIELIRFVGKQTLSIYLTHMPFAGIIANLFGRIDFWVFTIIRPFVVIILTLLFTYVYSKIVTNLFHAPRMLKFIGIKEG